MRIFLSYASEQRSIAEPIVFALRGRGHKVFFDKADLPPGGNYDAQIENAIKQSDLMIFLISPEAVSPGRFTLTELTFARQKWGTAQGHVFPVMAAPTPAKSIPVFLTSVHIMQPEGNAAAEVASFIDGLTPIARPLHILPVVLIMGIISGLLCGTLVRNPSFDDVVHSYSSLTFTQTITENILFIVSPAYGSIGHVPYIFSAVVALVLVIWDKIKLSVLLWVPPIIVAAWAVAYWLAFWIAYPLTEGGIYGSTVPIAPQCEEYIYRGDKRVSNPDYAGEAACHEIRKYQQQIKPLMDRLNWFVYTIAGMSAGFVGALLTVMGLGRLSPRLRPLDAIVLVTFIGTVAGTILNPRLFVVLQLEKDQALPVLFVVWQASVAMAIAWQFTKAPPAE
jgi:TIR domain-containing protein